MTEQTEEEQPGKSSGTTRREFLKKVRTVAIAGAGTAFGLGVLSNCEPFISRGQETTKPADLTKGLNKEEFTKLLADIKENPAPMEANTLYMSVLIKNSLYQRLTNLLTSELPEQYFLRHVRGLSDIIYQAVPEFKGLVPRRILVLDDDVVEPVSHHLGYKESGFADSDGVVGSPLIDSFMVSLWEKSSQKIPLDKLDEVTLHEIGHAVLFFPHWEAEGLTQEDRQDSTLSDVPISWKIYQGRSRNDRRGLMSYSDNLSVLEAEWIKRRLKNSPHNYEKHFLGQTGLIPNEFSKEYVLDFSPLYSGLKCEMWGSEEVKGKILLSRKIGEYSLDGKGQVVVDNPFTAFQDKWIANEMSALLLKVKDSQGKTVGIRWMDGYDFNLAHWLAKTERPKMSFSLATQESDPSNFDWTIKTS